MLRPNFSFQTLGLCALTLCLLPAQLMASHFSNNERIDIWPNIPFVRGADLCRYNDAYGQKRSESLNNMIEQAKNLMAMGVYGSEALHMLKEFNRLYERHQEMTTDPKGLSISLESTLKAYVDQYYRQLRPKFKRLSFGHGKGDGASQEELEKLDFFAYGSYALAPSCRGNIQVTLHLIGKKGEINSYVATGRPSVVMSQIASEMFTQFQRTQFPTTVTMGQTTLELIGGANGSVDKSSSPQNAQRTCQSLGARLPNQVELEVLDARGDWSGGVSLNNKTWAMPNAKVYAPYLGNPSPVRAPWEVNAQEFYYYCVR